MDYEEKEEKDFSSVMETGLVQRQFPGPGQSPPLPGDPQSQGQSETHRNQMQALLP